MLPSVLPRLSTDLAVRVFPGVWKLLSFLRFPSRDGALSLPLLSLFLYFFLPPFKDNGLLFWVPDALCQHSEVVLWNLLSVQMFFWWIYGGERGLPVLFLHHLLVFVLIFHVRDKWLLIICSVDFNKTQRAQGLTLSNLSVPATVL